MNGTNNDNSSEDGSSDDAPPPDARATIDQPWTPPARGKDQKKIPGLLVVYSGGRTMLQPLPFVDGALELGRETPALALDACLSRQHAEISHTDGRWQAIDRQSRNGTAVDGERLRAPYVGRRPRVIRLAESLLLPCDDLRPFDGAAMEVREDLVLGPTLGDAWARISAAARDSRTLHVRGETGVGKELAARTFHQLGPSPKGPMIGVNCAAIPHSLSERLLFGARRGAYSGANEDASGYFQAAEGGTLFLDRQAGRRARVHRLAQRSRARGARQSLPQRSLFPHRAPVGDHPAVARSSRGDPVAGRA